MENGTAGKDPVYSATSIIDFAKVAEFLDPIISSIATHDMTVSEEGGLYKVLSPFGKASLEPQPGKLRLAVETTERSALNRLKHALAGPIAFIAASENLEIIWSGDVTGLALPDDLRVLRVVMVEELTPRFRRITFHGDNLARYDRRDQLHCRLIFQPKDIASPEWPMLDDRGHVVWPKDRKLPTRVYTIRRIDAEAGELEVDFALHESAGPATQWAMDAVPGDVVGILGPAANGAKPADFYVFAGDETGLPAIARILEGLDLTAKGVAFIEIDNSAEEQALKCLAGMTIHWLYRNGAPAGTTSLLPDAVKSVEWPSDLSRVFFWGGCEHKAFRQIHRMLRNEVGLLQHRQVLFSHWHRSLSEEEIIAIGAEAYLP
ncbi:siderophore-interacting protein [Rhizobium gallicum]|uniref:Siderophore-interacting protein n=1 Tax=Rhizobium gallicum TaxID=56730 RepID=A0A1L5NME7_9HYPH|nr:siderophore-interacting protein [Rhizobium gallicum]APO68999.1 siderophore-interacting protein [Rhizobium gallicum]